MSVVETDGAADVVVDDEGTSAVVVVSPEVTIDVMSIVIAGSELVEGKEEGNAGRISAVVEMPSEIRIVVEP